MQHFSLSIIKRTIEECYITITISKSKHKNVNIWGTLKKIKFFPISDSTYKAIDP